MLLGRENESIIRTKLSLYSNVTSLIIEILTVALVIPAGNVALYGPES